jgi:hypothetical protein
MQGGQPSVAVEASRKGFSTLIVKRNLIVKDNFKPARRQFLRMGGAAIAMIPAVAFTGNALAATNPGMRASMKYQDTPNGDKDCANCIQFVPGKTPKDLGGCKLFPGDTEVAPKAYCAAWVAIPKK